MNHSYSTIGYMMQSMLGTSFFKTFFLTSGSFDILAFFVKGGSFGPSNVSHCKACNHIIVLIMRVQKCTVHMCS